jgi:uncharacterized DUF497 family protein
MLFEWDENKREINLARHKLDLIDGQILFDGRPVVSYPSLRDSEQRYVSTGQIGLKFYSVVWTERGEAIRLILFRRGRGGEERAYFARFG